MQNLDARMQQVREREMQGRDARALTFLMHWLPLIYVTSGRQYYRFMTHPSYQAALLINSCEKRSALARAKGEAFEKRNVFVEARKYTCNTFNWRCACSSQLILIVTGSQREMQRKSDEVRRRTRETS